MLTGTFAVSAVSASYRMALATASRAPFKAIGQASFARRASLAITVFLAFRRVRPVHPPHHAMTVWMGRGSAFVAMAGAGRSAMWHALEALPPRVTTTACAAPHRSRARATIVPRQDIGQEQHVGRAQRGGAVQRAKHPALEQTIECAVATARAWMAHASAPKITAILRAM
jgi:hypothetical protein